MPLVVDPVMVSSSGARLLEDDAVDTLVDRLFPLATVVTPNADEATALVGAADPAAQARRLVELGAAAAIVTGGGGAAITSSTARPSSRSPCAGTTSPRRTGPAARTRQRWPHCSRAARISSSAAVVAAATASDAVAHGLAELGAGEGPVDVFHLRGVR